MGRWSWWLWGTTVASLEFLLVAHAQRFEDKNDGQQSRPNVIFVLTDDVGFGDLACYGHPYAKTDHIDRLAKEGTLFRQFHVNGNICPITRAGLMTSRHPAWFPNYTEEYGFNGTLTITKLLQQQAGYTTGHIGKWNIGPNPDAERVEYGIDYLRVNSDSTFDNEGRERVRMDEAITFIEQQHQRGNQPFYLNLWLMALHTPINPPQSFLDQFSRLTVDRSDFGVHMQANFDRLEALGMDIHDTMRRYLADLLALDVQIGRLLDKLDDLSLTDNTIVIFSSDNGPADVEKAPNSLGYAGGLRGGKHTYYEGGTRVPFLVRWPGHVPAGRVDDASIMSGLDWLTTVATLAGVSSYPTHLVEGEDMSDVWLGATRSRTDPLFFRVIGTNGAVFVRYGRWKFHHGAGRQLYDLHTDPFEQTNIAATRPDIVAELSRVVKDWVATLPTSYRRSPGTAVRFNPNQSVQRIALPNIDDAFPPPRSTGHAGPAINSLPKLVAWLSSVTVMIHVWTL
jgi:arylsulfatase A-like enzyme